MVLSQELGEEGAVKSTWPRRRHRSVFLEPVQRRLGRVVGALLHRVRPHRGLVQLIAQAGLSGLDDARRGEQRPLRARNRVSRDGPPAPRSRRPCMMSIALEGGPVLLGEDEAARPGGKERLDPVHRLDVLEDDRRQLKLSDGIDPDVHQLALEAADKDHAQLERHSSTSATRAARSETGSPRASSVTTA